MESKYTQEYTVIKRDGSIEPFDASKISNRLTYLFDNPYKLRVNTMFVVIQTVDEVRAGLTTYEIDEIACQKAIELSKHQSDYMILAARIAISNHQKTTKDCFSGVIEDAYRNIEYKTKTQKPLICEELYKFVQYHKNELNSYIDYLRDFRLSMFGFTTLLSKYLIKKSVPKKWLLETPSKYTIEGPQDLCLRVACSLHLNNLNLRDKSVLPKIKKTYDLISMGYHSMASPTLFNAGTPKQQMLSCFLTGADDSTDGICKLQTSLSKISKHSGGIGFWWDLRASGEPVYGINGHASGPIPMMKILESTALAFDQGGKRAGSFASYLSPIHPDFLDWVKCRRPGGRIDRLYYGCWTPDIFMEAVESDSYWYQFCPRAEPTLYNTYGDDQADEYKRCIDAGTFKCKVKARDIWKEILLTQKQTGMPYMLYSDSSNKFSNQKNIGLIKSSNLCAEILEVSTSDEFACCVLGTMCLSKYVILDDDYKEGTPRGTVDYELLIEHTMSMAENLNNMIDINWYPVEETKRSNLRHRPISVGVQGLADLFMKLNIPFTSDAAMEINKKCSEYIYYGALRQSCNKARDSGKTYETFDGSDFSKGILQFHYYGLEIKNLDEPLQERWVSLIEDIKLYGTVNSLLTGYPPTASSSQIQGNNECFEPYTYIGYMRKTLAGECYVPCPHFVDRCIEEKIYSPKLMNELVEAGGFVTNLNIPDYMKEVFKTSWEMSNKKLMDMSIQRQPFIDQSQSLNQWVSNPTDDLLTKIHFYGWRNKLKTGMYYLRQQAASKSVGFGQTASSAATSGMLSKIKVLPSGKRIVCDDGSCCGV